MSETLSPLAALDQLLDANNRGDGNPPEDYEAHRIVREALEQRDKLIEVCQVCKDVLRDHVQYDDGDGSAEQDAYLMAVAVLRDATADDACTVGFPESQGE